MHESWLEVLGDELEQPYMRELRAFLLEEVAAGRGFYPPADRVFNALSLTPFDDVRVVVLGQDPYHGRDQAMGLCFSVPPGVPAPPSLQKLLAEVRLITRLREVRALQGFSRILPPGGPETMAPQTSPPCTSARCRKLRS